MPSQTSFISRLLYRRNKRVEDYLRTARRLFDKESKEVLICMALLHYPELSTKEVTRIADKVL